MGILTDDMKRVIAEQKLGFVATVSPDMTPNLSPKGTMLLLDDDHIMFGEIRSPQTLGNIKKNAAMEINFIDQFARKGYRFKGTARLIERSADEFATLYPRFAHFGALAEKIRGVVVLHVTRALPLTTPAYDVGATEGELRAHWLAYFQGLQPR